MGWSTQCVTGIAIIWLHGRQLVIDNGNLIPETICPTVQEETLTSFTLLVLTHLL